MIVWLSVASLGGAAHAQAERQDATATTRDQPKISVLGNVEKPGDYAYVEGQTVRTVIERAGGVKKGPDALHTYVLRVLDGNVKRCIASPDTPTKPWDLVTVDVEGGPRPVSAAPAPCLQK